MNIEDIVVDLDSKLKKVDALNKDLMDTYERNNKNLQEINHRLEQVLGLILYITENKQNGSDLHHIHQVAKSGLKTRSKVYARESGNNE